MALTSQDLDRPIDVADGKFAVFLDDLQGNILKGHGRELTANIFVRFKGAGASAVLAAFARDRLTTARMQLEQTATFKATGIGGGTVTLLFLSHSGYQSLGRAGDAPASGAFEAGMAGRRALKDPPAEAWDPHLRDVDGLILIGDDHPKALDVAVAKVAAALREAGVEIAGIERGRARFDAEGRGIEHFGYVDGRSQPLLLKSDVDEEAKKSGGGPPRWDPAFSPNHTVLVRDPGGATPDSYGAFFVFRKLEQDVRGFKERERELARELGLAEHETERAGAMVVGRFEDGTPVVLHDSEQSAPEAPNDFDYGADPEGLRCPFQAHIRKTNPRGDVAREHGLPPSADRDPIMARRGIPYGVRSDDGEVPADCPAGGVGLLFMAYQKDFERQFEFTQQRWVDDADFLRSGTGIDPVIGQAGGDPEVAQKWRARPEADPKEFVFANFVTMRGGAYFFAPSKSFLLSLDAAAAV